MFTKKRHEFLFELKDNEEISSLMGMSADELNEISIDVFELIREKVLQVSYKYANSLIITGGSGLGKTHEVKEALKESRERYKFVKGDITTAGLYQLLFEHKDELIVFDDCDAVFEDADPNILKAALDSYPEREVSRSIASYFSTKGMSMKDIIWVIFKWQRISIYLKLLIKGKCLEHLYSQVVSYLFQIRN
jgi:predicted AAA+ superfamily ATPase